MGWHIVVLCQVQLSGFLFPWPQWILQPLMHDDVFVPAIPDVLLQRDACGQESSSAGSLLSKNAVSAGFGQTRFPWGLCLLEAGHCRIRSFSVILIMAGMTHDGNTFRERLNKFMFTP